MAIYLGLACASLNVAFAQEPASAAEQWRLFTSETLNPLFAGAGAFNASISQLTHSDPKYGEGAGAFGQRLGASLADIATQNFFGDYVLASVLHEDTRYVRRGADYSFFSRVKHAAASGFVTRNFAGGETVNWSNIGGTAVSSAISELYYPRGSRGAESVAIHFGTSVVGAGLGNLAPEFWPDFHSWMQRHHFLHTPR